MIRFGLIRRCTADCQPGIHSRDSGDLRVLTRCLAFSLAATDSMVYRPLPPPAVGRPAVEPIRHNSATIEVQTAPSQVTGSLQSSRVTFSLYGIAHLSILVKRSLSSGRNFAWRSSCFLRGCSGRLPSGEHLADSCSVPTKWHAYAQQAHRKANH